MDTIKEIASGIPWFAWLGGLAIVAGTVKGIIGMTQRHEERLEQIRQGIDPGPAQDE